MRNTNSFALLGLLSLKPMTGYTMKNWVDKSLSHFWKTSYGQIYPTMNKFIRDGLVTVETVENEKGQASKLYTITEKGSLELLQWLQLDNEDINVRDETLLKLFFSSVLPVNEIIARFERSNEVNKSFLESYQADYSSMAERVPDPTLNQMLQYLCVRKGVLLNDARMKWQEECIEQLQWFQKKELKKQSD